MTERLHLGPLGGCERGDRRGVPHRRRCRLGDGAPRGLGGLSRVDQVELVVLCRE